MWPLLALLCADIVHSGGTYSPSFSLECRLSVQGVSLSVLFFSEPNRTPSGKKTVTGVQVVTRFEASGVGSRPITGDSIEAQTS